MVTLRADFPVALEIGNIKNRLALNAFLPQTFRHARPATARLAVDARWQNLVNPAHLSPFLPDRPHWRDVKRRQFQTLHRFPSEFPVAAMPPPTWPPTGRHRPQSHPLPG